jgi:hypothetical protein
MDFEFGIAQDLCRALRVPRVFETGIGHKQHAGSPNTANRFAEV